MRKGLICFIFVFVLFGGIVFLCRCGGGSIESIRPKIDAVVQGKHATVGVAVVGSDGEMFLMNDSVLFPMLSVFKFPLALTVLDRLDRTGVSIDSTIFVNRREWAFSMYSPMRDLYPDQDLTVSFRELLTYSVSLSDNHACDILLRYVGGPAVVERYIRSLGITDMTIVKSEEEMNRDPLSQYANRSTPSATARLMRLFAEDTLIRPEYEEWLIATMVNSTTGMNKLKRGISDQAVLAHKTGSSDRKEDGVKIADNDAGIVFLPDGRLYYIVVYVKDSSESDETNAQIIADISRIVYEYFDCISPDC